MPRYWLSGEEKKLLWKLRGNKVRSSDSGDYWRHLIPRTNEELEFKLDLVPDNALEEWTKVDTDWIWEDLYGEKLSQETFDTYKKWLDAVKDYMTPSGITYLPDETLQTKTGIQALLIWVPIMPFSLKECMNPVSGNRFESREWRPEIMDTGSWRKATEWECEHWDDLVTCSSCGHPTIPQLQCNVCDAPLIQPLTIPDKRILDLHCILPDFPLWSAEKTIEEEAEEILEAEGKELTELEDVIEEVISEKPVEREEDEETKDISDN